MCDVNDPLILNAYIAITEDEPTDWLLLGYKDSRDKISLYASGVNGLSEFRQHITNEILFGFIRVDDRFILITYVPDSVSGVRRARALVHGRAVANVLELSHAQFTASSLSDMSDANIRTRLKLGQNQVPNRARNMTTKRTSVIARRRKSAVSYSSSSPTMERNLDILTTEEPLSFDELDRSSTPAPSSPTSVASSFAESSISTEVGYHTFDLDAKKDATEAMLQLQLAKKKELEEARFRQFQKDQREERFRRDQAIKQLEIEEKKQKPFFKKELQTRKSFHVFQQKVEEQVVPPVVLRKVVTPDSKRRSTINSVAPLKVELKKVVPEALNDNSRKPSPSWLLKKETAPKSTIDSPKAQAIVIVPVVLKEAKEVVVKPETIIKTEPVKPKEVLMTGFASVQTDTSRFWRRRYFVIETDGISFYKDELAHTPISLIKTSHITRLAPADEDEDTYVPNSFMIDTQAGESYQIVADQKKIIKQIMITIQSTLL